MGYRLGVDLGTTFTAAAVDDGSGPVMLGLGNRALTVPSVVWLSPDGTFLFGEAADRRALDEPTRSSREFKRRIGDPVPILIKGRPFSPQTLSAKLLSWAVSVASERHGAPPEQVAVTFPANWGGYKRELMGQLISLADVPDAVTCTEPEAAAIQYSSHASLAVEDKVAVYDLGGGTFDVCVLEKLESGFRILGSPDGVEHLGGIDFDEAVFQHVVRQLSDEVTAGDADDAEVMGRLAQLRRACVDAKEALSDDVHATIPIPFAEVPGPVRITRAEFETLIEDPLRDTLDATRRALRSAGLDAKDLTTVVLVGGSSRIPLVTHLLQAELGIRPAKDTHPKHDVALGAVRYLEHAAGGQAPPAAPTVAQWPSRSRRVDPPAPAALPIPDVTPPSPPPVPVPPPPRSEPVVAPSSGPMSRGRSTGIYLTLAAVLVLVGALAAFALADRPSDPELSWAGAGRTGQTTAVARGTTVTTSVLGIPLPGDVTVRGRAGRFEVPQNLALFAAGPVDAFDETGSVGTLGRSDDAWWRPIATVPGAFLVLALLFAIAYAESQQRSLRRGRGEKPRPGELAALTGIGLTLGVCCLLLAWITGCALTWPIVLGTLVCFAAAFGMVAFGLASRRPPR
jgi:actin-like ATPase involved in cell morphogenesis